MPEDCDELWDDATEELEEFYDSIRFFNDAAERYYSERERYDSLTDFLRLWGPKMTDEDLDRLHNFWKESLDKWTDKQERMEGTRILMHQQYEERKKALEKAKACIHEETPISMELEGEA